MSRSAAGAESYAAVWREPGGAIASGKVTLDRDAIRLQGTTREGHLSRREIPYAEIAGVRIGREPGEQVNSRRTLVLERISAPPLLLDVVGAGTLFELADLLAALTLEHRDRYERIVLVLPLDEQTIEQARALVASGPTFDPAEAGLERHEVFFTDREAVFLFEGPDVSNAVQRLAGDQSVFRSAVEWRLLLTAAPRLARPAYSWPDRTSSPSDARAAGQARPLAL